MAGGGIPCAWRLACTRPANWSKRPNAWAGRCVQCFKAITETPITPSPGVWTGWPRRQASTDLRKFCRLDAAGSALLKTALSPLQLSAQAFHQGLTLARTIADLAG